MIDGAIFGYLGSIWCVANLMWAMFRNDAHKAMIYGIGVFATIVVMLNIGGILNDTTWTMFGIGVFGLELIVNVFITKVLWKTALYSIMLTASTMSLLGVV